MAKDIAPVSRLEKIVSGESVDPKTRLEAILSDEDIEPITRKEYFLKKSRSGGGSGNTGMVRVRLHWDGDTPGKVYLIGFSPIILGEVTPMICTVSNLAKNATLSLPAVEGIATLSYKLEDSSPNVTSWYSSKSVGIVENQDFLTTDGTQDVYDVYFHATSIN